MQTSRRKILRTRTRLCVSLGDIPDAGTGAWPDGPVARLAVSSGMSAVSDSLFNPAACYETKWDEVFVVAARSDATVAPPHWRPAVNAYRCSGQFVVFAELAGVPAESIEVRAEPGRLMIRGRRPAPEPACTRSELAQLLALEIDQGAFERTLDLPQDIDPAGATTEYRDGLLQIKLPLVG